MIVSKMHALMKQNLKMIIGRLICMQVKAKRKKRRILRTKGIDK
jgi:hypothetical protein